MFEGVLSAILFVGFLALLLGYVRQEMQKPKQKPKKGAKGPDFFELFLKHSWHFMIYSLVRILEVSSKIAGKSGQKVSAWITGLGRKLGTSPKPAQQKLGRVVEVIGRQGSAYPMIPGVLILIGLVWLLTL